MKLVEGNQQESARFCISAARVTDPLADLSRIDAAARAQRVEMLTLRIDTQHITRVRVLEENGYRLMDTLVYYDRALTKEETAPESPPGQSIRLAQPGDAGAAGDVARAAFADYFGHYHADPRLSKAAADAVYVDWAETSVRNSSTQTPVFVAQEEGRIVGFLTLRQNTPDEEEIVLNAVHPDVQSQGVYGRLLGHAIAHAAAAGRSRIIVSTQVNNIAVQRAWGKSGLRMFRSLYTFHKWF